MMYHLRQVFVLGVIIGIVALIILPCIQTQEQPMPEIRIEMPIQEMTPQQFEQKHQRVPVEQPVSFLV